MTIAVHPAATEFAIRGHIFALGSLTKSEGATARTVHAFGGQAVLGFHANPAGDFFQAHTMHRLTDQIPTFYKAGPRHRQEPAVVIQVRPSKTGSQNAERTFKGDRAEQALPLTGTHNRPASHGTCPADAVNSEVKHV